MGKCNLDDPEVRAQLAAMGSQTILFPPERETVFLGRNGQGRCVGVKVQDNVSSLVLFPITSRREAGRCQIHIPKQDAKYVAAALDPSDRVTVTRQDGRYVVVVSKAGAVTATVRVADLYELSKVFEHLDDQHAYDEDCPLCTGGF